MKVSQHLAQHFNLFPVHIADPMAVVATCHTIGTKVGDTVHLTFNGECFVVVETNAQFWTKAPDDIRAEVDDFFTMPVVASIDDDDWLF